MKLKRRMDRKGIEAGNGGGSIDCTARSQALPSHRRYGWTDGRTVTCYRCWPESSSFLIPQERKLRDILVLLLSVPPKQGKGTSPLFLRPTFRPRRASPRILLSVTPSCSFDRHVDTLSDRYCRPKHISIHARNTE